MAATGVLVLRVPVRNLWHDELYRDAIEPSGALAPRLTTTPRSRTPLASMIAALPLRRGVNATAAALLDRSEDDASAEASHRTGVAYFLHGNFAAAAQHLRTAASREPHAEWWSDLAAAEIRAGEQTGDHDRNLAALDAADRALLLDPQLSAARVNRAMILERLGLHPAAMAEWQKANATESNPSWARIVSAHLHDLSRQKTAREQMADAQKALESGRMPSGLESLAGEHPQEARAWSEVIFLGRWGKQTIAGENGDLYLDAARIVGKRLASRSGERILHDTVALIDAARKTGDQRRLTALAQGASAYDNGRLAFNQEQLDVAAREFATARERFATAGSSMAEAAELYLAMHALKSNRNAAARASFVALRDRTRAMPGHDAITANAEQYIALIDAMSGRWGDALETARSSRARFARIGERNNAAEAGLIMGNVLEFLGRPAEAWREYARSAAAFSAAGTWDRLQVCAAAMNHLELRRGRWSSARALSRVEFALGSSPQFLAYVHLRAGAAAFGAGDSATARISMREARKAAASIELEEIREPLLADIAAVEGRVLIASDPAAAAALLTESIDFQVRADRAYALPELYLERGRAILARGALDAALVDLDRGIRTLELQRSRVREQELRAGFFDDARQLFAEAVAVSLRLGAVDQAFGYLERGRARTLLDQLGSDAQVDTPAGASINSLQQNLAPGMVLVSYAILNDRVAIFVADQNPIEVRYSDVRPDALRRTAGELGQAMKRRGDVIPPAAALYDALILPVRDRLARAHTIVIIPDPELEQVPFGALYDRASQTFLIASQEILGAPSAAVFVECARRAKQPAAPAPQSIAIFANPAMPPDAGVPSLPAADREAPSIAGHYARPLMLRRDTATAARFRSEAPRHEVVQFSGHAKIDRAEPWKSVLLLDQRLTAREIASLRFSRTRLTVLGACSTLAPIAGRAEGTSPIASSFLIAGVPAVVGSLWDVDDGEAAAFTARLHEHLASGIPAATALRNAQRDMLRNENVHPAAWAAFTLVGADRRP